MANLQLFRFFKKPLMYMYLLASFLLAGSATRTFAADNADAAALDYVSLLKAFAITHADLVDNPDFAWYYFDHVSAPGSRDIACTDMKRESQNPIQFSSQVEAQHAAFSSELKALSEQANAFRVRADVDVWIDQYDQERQVFPVSRVLLRYNSGLNPQTRCGFYNKPTGIMGYVPKRFEVVPVNEVVSKALPMALAEAERFLSQPEVSSYGRSPQNLRGVADITILPVPFMNKDGTIEAPVRIERVTMTDPGTGAVYHVFEGEDLQPVPQESVPARDPVPVLTPAILSLWMIRGDPDILTETVINDLTQEQILREQQQWASIEGFVGQHLRALNGGNALHSPVNAAKPVFSYAWQDLRRSRPEVAAALLHNFIRGDAAWTIYENDPDYDGRLIAHVVGGIFSREALGLPPLEALTGDRSRPELPTAASLVPDLRQTMHDFLLAAANAAPAEVRLETEVQSSLNLDTRLLHFDSYRKPEPIDVFSPIEQARFMADGPPPESGSGTLLPLIAEGRALYKVPPVNEPRPDFGEKLRLGDGPAQWRELILHGRAGASVQALALDRPLQLAPMELPMETIARAQGSRPRPNFPVTLRVVLQAEGADVANIHEPDSRRTRPRAHGVWLGTVKSLEILDENRNLMTTVDL